MYICSSCDKINKKDQCSRCGKKPIKSVEKYVSGPGMKGAIREDAKELSKKHCRYLLYRGVKRKHALSCFRKLVKYLDKDRC